MEHSTYWYFTGDPEHLIHSLKCGGILVTSYTGVLIHKELLVNMDWHYVILDEGHKIRNPEAKVSAAWSIKSIRNLFAFLCLSFRIISRFAIIFENYMTRR